MEPRRTFVERLRVVESRRVHEMAEQSRGIVEFDDGDRYQFSTEITVEEGAWYTAVGRFDEEHGKPVVFLEEVVQEKIPQE